MRQSRTAELPKAQRRGREAPPCDRAFHLEFNDQPLAVSSNATATDIRIADRSRHQPIMSLLERLCVVSVSIAVARRRPFIWPVTGDTKTTGEIDEMSGITGDVRAPASGPRGSEDEDPKQPLQPMLVGVIRQAVITESTR